MTAMVPYTIMPHAWYQNIIRGAACIDVMPASIVLPTSGAHGKENTHDTWLLGKRPPSCMDGTLQTQAVHDKERQ